jgi:drug/metabolite transporter (DMT)-like permease
VSRRHFLLLLAVAALWGSSFMFIKIGVRELAPTTLICLRLAIGALTVLPVALVRVGGRQVARELRVLVWPLLFSALVNSSLPITSLAWAETRIDSGLAAVFQAAAPLFAALLALRFSRSDRVTGTRLVGLLIGFGGVAMLVGVQPSGNLLAAFAVLFSALCYAVAALYTGRSFGEVSPLVSAFGMLVWATIVLVPPAVVQAPSSFPSWEVVGALLALGTACTGVAYVLYFAVLTGAGGSYGILVTYLVPAFALVYGAVFLDEPVTVSAVGGLALVLGGVALGSGRARLPRRRVGATAVGR